MKDFHLFCYKTFFEIALQIYWPVLFISVISEEDKTYKNDYRLQVLQNLTVYPL